MGPECNWRVMNWKFAFQLQYIMVGEEQKVIYYIYFKELYLHGPMSNYLLLPWLERMDAMVKVLNHENYYPGGHNPKNAKIKKCRSISKH
jgi:hypothetical protein